MTFTCQNCGSILHNATEFGGHLKDNLDCFLQALRLPTAEATIHHAITDLLIKAELKYAKK